jgi:riboflavin biosynthesis pyrimidine reductase
MHAVPLTGPEIDADALIALYANQDLPWVRMNFVSTIDGAVEVDGRSGALGGAADKTVFGVLRMLADGIMVGAGTLRKEEYRALRPTAERRAWREAAGMNPFPRLVVVSGSLNLDPSLPALVDAPVRPVVITHAASDDERRDALSNVADVLVHGVDRVDLVSAVTELRDGYRLEKILCEGGPQLFGALYAANLVDEVCLTLSPLLAGPGSGRIIAGPGAAIGDAVTRMRLAHALVAESALLLRYVRP